MTEQVSHSLQRLEIVMKRLEVWWDEPPAEEALQSTQPFCVDTLEFTQWLQFIFLPRMWVLVEAGRPLPQVSGMAPMAEEHFRSLPESGRELIDELARMDDLLSGQ